MHIGRRSLTKEQRQQVAAEIRTSRIIDEMANSRTGSDFLLYGSANPTRIQRIGVWLFGLMFSAAGVVTLVLARAEHSVAFGLIAIPLFALGVRLIGNGFKQHTKG